MAPTHSIYTLPSGLSFRMVNVPGTGAGHFIMGSPKDEEGRDDDEAQHPVRLSDFQLGEFAVTQELWESVMGNNPAQFKGNKRPVEQVSWYDAAVFCNALNVALGKQPPYRIASAAAFGWDEAQKRWILPNEGSVICNFQPGCFRLPSEAEWEYAARGGHYAEALQTPAETDYLYAGSDQLEQVGWYSKNSGKETHEVGLLLPNALGLYDMSGNVLEWCYDWFSAYPKDLKTDPVAPKQGSLRVLRGGTWLNLARDCRVAFRDGYSPGLRYIYLGFRLASAPQ